MQKLLHKMRNDNIIRRVLLLTAVIASICTLSSCSEITEPQAQNKTDSIFSYNITDDTSPRYYCQQQLTFETETGVYFCDTENYIYYYDIDAGKTVLVCNKPGCSHDRWFSDTPEAERCDGNIGYGGTVSGFVYGGKLYTVVTDMLTNTTTLTRSQRDRSDQEDIALLDADYVYGMYVYDGVLYMDCTKYEFAAGDEGATEMTGRAYSWLCRIDLESGHVTELTDRELRYNGSFSIKWADRDCLYYTSTYFNQLYDGTNFSEAEPQCELYEYNITTSEITRIPCETDALVAYPLAVENRRVYLAESNGTEESESRITAYDIADGKTDIISEAAYGYNVDWSSKRITFTNKNEADKYIYIYDMTTDNTVKRDKPQGFEPWMFLENYVFGFNGVDDDGSLDGYQYSIMSKDEYYSGGGQVIDIERGR